MVADVLRLGTQGRGPSHSDPLLLVSGKLEFHPIAKRQKLSWKASLLCLIFCTVLLLHIKFFEMIKAVLGESFKNVFGQDLKCFHCF